MQFLFVTSTRPERPTPGLEKEPTGTALATHDGHGREATHAPCSRGCWAVCWVTCRIHPWHLSLHLRRPGRETEPRGACLCPESHTALGQWRGGGHTGQTRTPHGMGTFSRLGSEILNHGHWSDPVDKRGLPDTLATINEIDSSEKERQTSTGIEATGDGGRIEERERPSETKDAPSPRAAPGAALLQGRRGGGVRLRPAARSNAAPDGVPTEGAAPRPKEPPGGRRERSQKGSA